MNSIKADFDQPLIFRTTNEGVCKSTLETGSLWLRSDKYYRDIEDLVRRDTDEGVNLSRVGISLSVAVANEPLVNINGYGGSIGQQIVPHYILSLHGSSISLSQRQSFGPKTFGVKNLMKLAHDTFYHAQRVIDCYGFRYGPVSYRHTALTVTKRPQGGSAIQFGNCHLNAFDTDVLRKAPVQPFVEQDEWRIVVFTNGYKNNDPNAPLIINVDNSHFYAYID